MHQKRGRDNSKPQRHIPQMNAIWKILGRFPSEHSLKIIDDDDESGRRPAPVSQQTTIAEVRAARVEAAILEKAFQTTLRAKLAASDQKDHQNETHRCDKGGDGS